ncbi:MAG: hypothetical protein PVSMB3_12460 [Candidatus Dormibacteraceae bacterium]
MINQPLLTRRRLEVARLIAAGLSNRQIAARLFLSERTIEWHIDQILKRLRMTSRAQIAAWIGREDTTPEIASPLLRPISRPELAAKSFVGRHRELVQLRQFLSEARLVTITGPPGVGKTRLAAHAAWELGASNTDGAAICNVQSARDAEGIVSILATALGLTDILAGGIESLRDHLSSRMVLLVFDGCEALRSPVARIVASLLSVSPGLRIIVASRSPIRAIGEVCLALGPLDAADAIRLFTDRATEAAPNLPTDSRNAETVATICAQLGGSPLAIELAAATLKSVPLTQLVEVVSSRGRLRGTRRGLKAFQSLADWSYERLDTREQQLFRRLGMFRGWFDVRDAAALIADDWPIATLLDNLVESSFIERDQVSEAPPQFRIVEGLRPVAVKRLNEEGDLDAARFAHAERMVSLAEQVELHYEESHGVRPKLASMIEDIRAALGFLVRASPQRAAWMAGGLRGLWLDLGRPQEGLRWTSLASRAYTVPSAERCWLLYTRAILLLQLGRRAESDQILHEATQLARLSACAPLRGDLLVATGLIESARGDYIAAEAAQRGAIEAFSLHGQLYKTARPLNHLAISLLFQERPSEAAVIASRSVEMRRGTSIRLQPALDTLAQADAILGRLEEAETGWLEAFELGIHERDPITVIDCLQGLAFVAGRRLRTDAALMFHYCAEHALLVLGRRYTEALEPHLRGLMEELEQTIAPERGPSLKTEGASLAVAAAFRLAQAEHRKSALRTVQPPAVPPF